MNIFAAIGIALLVVGFGMGAGLLLAFFVNGRRW